MRRLRLAGLLALLLVVGLALLATCSGRQKSTDRVARLSGVIRMDLESSLVELPDRGVELHVVQAGPKRHPVVMLHGFPEYWWSWREPMVMMARNGFRSIVPDQRGYSRSSKPRSVAAYRIEELVADVVALLDALGHERVFLAGHDLGAVVAWQLAIRHPERVRRLMIFQGAHPQAFRVGDPEAGEDSVRFYRTLFQIPLLPELALRFGNWAPLTRGLRRTSAEATFDEELLDAYREAWDQKGAMRGMLNWYRAAARYPVDLTGDMTVQVPTRIVFGLQDAYIDERFARASLRFCRDAELVEVPEASHWILQEQPKLVIEQMLDFFDPR